MDDDFRISTCVAGCVATLYVAGELDAATAPDLDEQVRRLEAEHPSVTDIVVDLAGLDFIDSAGLSVLVAGHTRLRDRGASLCVTRPSPAARRVFAISGLDAVLTIV